MFSTHSENLLPLSSHVKLSSANSLNLEESKMRFSQSEVVLRSNLQKLGEKDKKCYFMLSDRISRKIGENIFRSYTGTTSENTDFHVLVA